MEDLRKPSSLQFELTDLTWEGLAREKDSNPLIKRGGVYIFRSCIDNEQPAFIPRVLSSDPFGILYIGMSKCLFSRLWDFVMDLKSPDDFSDYKDKHSAAKRYSTSERMRHLYPYEKLIITCIPSPLYEESEFYKLDKQAYKDWYSPREMESRILHEYIDIYGELPPLNFAQSHGVK